MAIDHVVKKFRLGQEPIDANAWQGFSYHERLSALESIRKEYHSIRYGAEPRLQRVLRVTQQTRG